MAIHVYSNVDLLFPLAAENLKKADKIGQNPDKNPDIVST